MTLDIKETKGRIVFKVRIQPKASKNRIMGRIGDAIKIAVTAPPVEGEANRMCINFLAKQLRVKRSSLEILSGRRSKTKLIGIIPAEKKEKNTLLTRLKSLASPK